MGILTSSWTWSPYSWERDSRPGVCLAPLLPPFPHHLLILLSSSVSLCPGDGGWHHPRFWPHRLQRLVWLHRSQTRTVGNVLALRVCVHGAQPPSLRLLFSPSACFLYALLITVIWPKLSLLVRIRSLIHFTCNSNPPLLRKKRCCSVQMQPVGCVCAASPRSQVRLQRRLLFFSLRCSTSAHSPVN